MSHQYGEQTVIVSGFAQLPKGTTLYEFYKTIGAVMVINIETGIIEECEFSFVNDLSNRYVSSLMQGCNIHLGIQPLLEKIKNHVYFPSQAAIIQSVRSVYDRFVETRKALEEI